MADSSGAIQILHVDDEPDFADLTAAFLEREDDRFTVRTATNAEEGLAALDKGDIDCVISDYDMPGRNGIEFLESVRMDHPDLPFILFTGKGSEEIASEAISAGVTDYLQKQSDTSQYTVLANRVANAVEQSRSKHALEASQKRLSLFVEQSPLGVIEWNDDFECARVNDAARDILGYSEDELLGSSWEAIVPRADQGEVDRIVSELLEGDGGYHSINENVQKDGGRIICEWHNRVVTDWDGDVVAIFSQFQDITERRNEQRELERHRSVVQAATNTIITVDESNVIQSVNPAIETTFGYSPEELVGQPITVLMSEDIARRHRAAFERYLRTDERTLDWEYAEFPAQHRDGTTVPLSVTFSEITHDSERLFVGILRDISDRKARQQELERSNALLSTLFETLPVGVLVEDSSRNVLAANQRLFELFEIPGTPEEVIGTNCERIAKGVSEMFVDPETFVGNTNELVDSRDPVDGEELPLGDGRAFERSYRPIGLPEGGGHLWMYRDVTDRTERSRDHEATIESLQTLYELTTDPDLAFEAKITRLLELGCETLGLPYGFLTRIETDERGGDGSQTIVNAVGDHELLRAGQSCPLSEAYCRKTIRNDSLLAIQDAIAAGWEDDPAYGTFDLGCYIGVKVIVDDELYGTLCFASSNPRRNAFRETDRSFVRLISKWASYELERRQARAELERQNDRLAQFTSVVSHDLRNPLNVAQGRLELAREQFDSDDLDDVAAAHDRMNELIEDLLALAREGDELDELVPVELATVVEDCWGHVDTADATILTDVDGMVRADRGRLQQLLENLVRNAVEHGGEAVTVTVGKLPDGFYVADDGPGIPEADRVRVFEAGYSTTVSGTGFGLSIVKQVADAHGWEICIAEGADGGARFEITDVEPAGE